MSSTIQYRPISNLKTWPQNYRKGDIPAIIVSIRRFGFNGVLRTKGDMVFAGNHSLLALRELKALGDACPVGVTSKGDEWLVATLDMSHLTHREAEAFAIADNRTHDRGNDDTTQLLSVLSNFRDDPELEFATGYSENDVLDLLDELQGEMPTTAERKDASPLKRVVCPNCGEEFCPNA